MVTDRIYKWSWPYFVYVGKYEICKFVDRDVDRFGHNFTFEIGDVVIAEIGKCCTAFVNYFHTNNRFGWNFRSDRHLDL